MKYKAQNSIVSLSIVIFIYLLYVNNFSFPTELVEFIAEFTMFLACAAVMYYIEQLKPYPSVYWVMLIGSAFYYFYSYMNILEEFFLHTQIGPKNLDDVVQTIGFLLLCLGIHYWIALHRSFILKLQIKAETDHLTGLSNRRAFFKEMQTKANQEKSIGGAFLIMDIDHFKSVNDTYGHTLGDTVLEGVAQELKSHIRANDILARWGGEEFLLYLDDVTDKEALIVAESLRKFIEQLTFQYEGENVQCTISIGIYNVNTNIRLDTAIDRADKALYQAKSLGRNCVVVDGTSNNLKPVTC